jgi:hypothetical protein
MENTKFYNVEISPVLHGFVVTVGCQTLAFETVASMLFALNEYYNSPDDAEKKYRAKSYRKVAHLFTEGESEERIERPSDRIAKHPTRD